jgi:hypothetical protein
MIDLLGLRETFHPNSRIHISHMIIEMDNKTNLKSKTEFINKRLEKGYLVFYLDNNNNSNKNTKERSNVINSSENGYWIQILNSINSTKDNDKIWGKFYFKKNIR